MKISDILKLDAIIADLKAKNKPEAIKELSQAVSPVAGAEVEDVAAVLMEREHLGSTGIGGGIAIPHGKLETVKSIAVGFGRSIKGIEFESLDNRPVHLFFLLLTPEHSTGGHLKVLAQISKLLKMDQFKERLLAAGSTEQIHQIILENDEEF
ncbi:MAG TPA: PTS fructose transporter subunit IIA [Desulfobacter sp.]|jgi:PTS system nitrogen regulatory IIA component|uniref:PTS sugar transporter subunit IIA n=1 Tax=unclassified Desulfobacter TaxID=2634406 RepID=UPI000E8F2E55|nr:MULTISPECIES: PTS sugar transporter subunit IIA [unclassified Desulfobacter]MDQ1270337.1 nitrogen system component [Thermodesulfobacteriota bacterium]HRF90993.1 PTS sugar transporter subunit IIA [Desulfobacter postgatei]MBP8829278.1 PTS sugar transporter subunit IIA [Desulfobacter sp.]MBP9597721.1 PTS sugar transporter subunit IIA [Desulfobacter sp.]HAR33577.1 PTS fructose transporter subunit IIA [Desulfobacter sp.]